MTYGSDDRTLRVHSVSYLIPKHFAPTVGHEDEYYPKYDHNGWRSNVVVATGDVEANARTEGGDGRDES